SVGGALIYLALYRIVRRASAILAAQQKQIMQNEAFVAMGEMSAAVAHSLRNPLASIRSSAELVQEIAPPNVHRNVADIILQVDRMASWVRDLLATSSPSAAAAEPVDPIAAIHETLAAYQPQIRACQVNVELALPETAQPVVSQRVLLLQVLNSLVSNALEAMPKGGKLSIELTRAESSRKFAIIVSDTGEGMSEAQRKRLFQPFTTTKRGGLGVGLVMVKRIMERFGGAVDIHSTQDQGTRVELTLQLAS
ncbi:MAG: HAMP domain-containing sensor histidine kinase, partial [Acidobacteria bacterium]|nr:HAMP domain-containing sensor histidine kinase [Acidobacteriota bacterium]